MLNAAALLLSILLTGAGPVAQAAEIVLEGPRGTVRLSHAELASMPRVTVSITDHGKPATFEGVELRHLMTRVGMPAGEAIRGKDVASYVLVEAADGYRTIFALAELDPSFTDRKVILADRQAGQPLGSDVGPVRIIVEGEKRMSRSARQVVKLSLHSAPGGSR